MNNIHVNINPNREISRWHEVYRTGRKRQFYTLYSCLTGPYGFIRVCIIPNLSFDHNSAIEKAKKYCGNAEIRTDKEARPVFETLEAFEMKWKKGKKCFYGIPNQKFWSEWKENKPEIKKAGFWVSKCNDGTFLVFKKLSIVDWQVQ